MRASSRGAPTGNDALALAAVCMGFFLIQLDATIVNVALPQVQHDLGGSVGDSQWVVDSYTLALACLMLAAGSTADRLGARRVFQCGLVIFVVGSAACAAAWGLGWLVAARAVQGIGAAALLPCSLALIVHQFPDPSARARALGVWGGIGGLGMAAGPALGGVIVQLIGWRAVFVVNLPIGVLTWLAVRRAVSESERRRDRGTDVPGLAAALVALAGITAGFIEAGQRGWSSPVALIALAIGIVAGIGFVRVEAGRAAPMVPLGLFRSRAFGAATGMGFVFNLCLYGALLCLSLYLQQGRHLSALDSGLAILPMTIVVGVGALVSGRFTARAGPRAPMMTGMASGAIGAAVLAVAGNGDGIAPIVVGAAVLGLCSLAMPAMTSVVVGHAPVEHAGVASGILNAARQAGGAVGVAVLGSLLATGADGQPTLRVALTATAAAYLVAVLLAWIATRDRSASNQEPSS